MCACESAPVSFVSVLVMDVLHDAMTMGWTVRERRVRMLLIVRRMVMIDVGALEVADPLVEGFDGFHLKLPARWRARVTGGCVSERRPALNLSV